MTWRIHDATDRRLGRASWCCSGADRRLPPVRAVSAGRLGGGQRLLRPLRVPDHRHHSPAHHVVAVPEVLLSTPRLTDLADLLPADFPPHPGRAGPDRSLALLPDLHATDAALLGRHDAGLGTDAAHLDARPGGAVLSDLAGANPAVREASDGLSGPGRRGDLDRGAVRRLLIVGPSRPVRRLRPGRFSRGDHGRHGPDKPAVGPCAGRWCSPSSRRSRRPS